jgi:hypothetical protein
MILAKKKLKDSNIELIAKDEEFRSVKGWGTYYISNYGRLVHSTKKGYRIVNPSIAKGGYLSYTLSRPARTYKGKKIRDEYGKIKKRRSNVTANRLVAMMFVSYDAYTERYDYDISYLDAHHKDHNRKNNYCKNIMWLSSGRDGTRSDHKFINDIKKIAIVNGNRKRHTYKDIERLCKRLDLNILELIDILKDEETYSEPYTDKDGDWTVYDVNGTNIAVQRYNHRTTKRCKKKR